MSSQPSFTVYRFAICSLAVVWTVATATAQTPPGTFGETVDVELVNVEVWVTDGKGNAVTGLTADDFEVREDGRPVTISYFDEVRGVGVPDLSLEPLAEPALSEREAAPPEEAAGELGTPGYLVLYFNETFLGPSGRKRLIEDLRNFVEARFVTPQRILILRQAENLTVEAPLGSSRGDLDAALAKLVKATPRGIQTFADEKNAVRRLQDEWEKITVIGSLPPGADPCDFFAGVAMREIQDHASLVEARISETLSHLDSTASFLAGLPGLKTLIYVSDGLTTTPGTNLLDYVQALCPGQQGERRLDYRVGMSQSFHRLTRHANANRVTMYTIQALGMNTRLSLTGADQRGVRNMTRSASRYESATRAQQREGLTFLAAETGGRAIFNRNRLTEELVQIAEDMSGYYSLAYAPPHGGDGLEHTIKVRVRGAGLRVRHRPGYRDKRADERMAERLESTLRLNLMANPLAVRLGAGQIRQGEGRKVTVPFRVIVPAERITFLPRQGSETARIKVQVMAQNERRRKAVFTQEIFQLPRPEAADSVSLALDLELAEGVYVVAFGVRDEASQETSYVSTGIDLRPAEDGR